MSQDSLKEYLEMMAKMSPRGIEKFVLDFGQYWVGKKRPPHIKKGRDKECFKNALDLSLIHPGYQYVEGIASNIIPTHHAWCIDSDGDIVDPTWANPEDCFYAGVAIPRDIALTEIIRNKTYGLFVIDNWRINIKFMEKWRQKNA